MKFVGIKSVFKEDYDIKKFIYTSDFFDIKKFFNNQNLSQYNGIYCWDNKINYFKYLVESNYVNKIMVKFLNLKHPFFKG